MPFSLEAWLRAAIAAADALAQLHQSGIIHQNIRPQTLRIAPETYEVELTDAALDLEPEPPGLRLPIEALPYMAPEQTGRLDGAVDHRVDLYSLGIVLYEKRAGTLPFHADDALGWVHCHLARTPRALVAAAPDTPVVVSDIVMKLLAKSPDERYQSAQGLAYDLQRCLKELSEQGIIAPFPLGARDVWDKIRASSRLYGRREEIAALRGAFERVLATGRSEAVVITGPSGIGKSALLRELSREGRGRACFLSGKFEQNRRDIPYATLGRALEDLIRQTVASTDAELAMIREQLEAALGPNGQLIVDLIPQLELVIGKQPPVPPLPPQEAQNRFHLVFRSFLGVFATHARPLVLFLDDLQWADFATLELLQHVTAHPDVRSLLLVGAYRDDEVSESHPVEAALAEIRGAGVPISSIKLRPLSQAELTELVTDLFGCDEERAKPLAALLWAKPLAALLWAKTSGNPFFATQLLRALDQELLIHFDTRSWSWRWDIAEIEAREITDDMVELVLAKLRRLSGETLEVLKLAACVGSEFSLQMLGTLCGKTTEEMRRALEPALQDGLLLQRTQGYKFLHDRVLQAVYSLIPEDDRAGLHLRFGWLLLDRTSDAALDGVVFDIVNQLNLGVSRVAGADERLRIAELNLRAGRKAKTAIAARSAAKYLSIGLSLLPWDGWGADYALAYGLHLELAECEYLSGRFDEAERLCVLLERHARTRVDRAAAHRLRIQLATAQADSPRALAAGLECLRLFGIQLPQDPSDADVLAEIGQVRDALGDRDIESLVDLPVTSDPDTIAAMDVLGAVIAAALYVKPNLAHLMVARMVHLSIQRGNTPASVHAYATLGNILCARHGSFRDGYRFGKLALDLSQRPGFGGYQAEALVYFAQGILPWSRHAREALEHFRVGFRIARELGKLLYAGVCVAQNPTTLLLIGEPLEAVQEAILPALEFLRASKYEYISESLKAMQRFVLAMRGGTDGVGTLNGEGFDEGNFEEELVRRGLHHMRLWLHIHRLTARYLAGEHQGAYAVAQEARDLVWSGLYTMLEAEFFFYSALAAAAVYEEESAAGRKAGREMMASGESKLARWAESCPDNFAGKLALVRAEIARTEGKLEAAAALYDQAIHACRKNGFVQDEGIACELAGRLALHQGRAIVPEAYLQKARACFERWGAVAKVTQLECVYGGLLTEPRRESARLLPSEAAPMDTLTAAKASAAISSEMAPGDLLATLMRILIEHAGAQRASLLLPSRDGLGVAAEITTDQEGMRAEIPRSRKTPSATEFPLSIAHYVRRTREKVILDDMAAGGMFSADPYFAGATPRSILCAPIVRRGDVAGILYLENKLVRGAFTARRLALLEFLAAISLENALLADDLAREAAGRTQAENTLRQSEERLARLIETANVVPWEVDRATGQFTYVGPQAVKMLGYPHEAWLAPGFVAAHVHPEDRDDTLLHLIGAAGDEGFDFRMIAADGRTVWLHNVVSARRSDGPDALGGFLFDVTERKEAEATLKEKLRIIETQQTAIQKLSTPIIEVWEGVLTIPVLGVVDEARAQQMMSVVLEAVSRSSCQYMIIDLTGVDTVDTNTADYLMRIVRAVQLLGAQSIVVGIRPEVAQTIVAMGVDLSSIVTLSNLRGALLLCMRGAREQAGPATSRVPARKP